MPSTIPDEPHRDRELAESFGADPLRYDRARPDYPQELIDRIVAASPGPDVLDVGIGSGVSARPFAAAGCRVHGVDVDDRMARFAREHGFTVEIAKFEEWDPAGRTFDAIVSGHTWHWVDPASGAFQAVGLLRPRGLLAAFWNVQQPPPDVARTFSEVYRRVLPGTPFADGPRDALEAYDQILDTAAEGIEGTGAFTAPERWRFDWERRYTKAEWLDQLPTFGGHSEFPPAKLDELSAGIGAAIDATGGSFTMGYATLAIVATLAPSTTP